MNWFARLCALLLVLAPAAVAAQGAQKGYVGDGGGGQATNVPPPPVNTESSMSVGGAMSKTFSATKSIIDVGLSVSPGSVVDGKFVPSDGMVTKTTGALKTGSNVIKTAKVLSSGYDAASYGNYAQAGKEIAKAATAQVIDECVDKVIAVTCTALTTPAGALPCTAAVKLVKFCAETLYKKTLGQAFVNAGEDYIGSDPEPDSATTNGDTVRSTNWSESRKEYVDYNSKNAPASQAGCHPGHDELAHPGGCFD